MGVRIFYSTPKAIFIYLGVQLLHSCKSSGVKPMCAMKVTAGYCISNRPVKWEGKFE